jgi:hypothetical protein
VDRYLYFFVGYACAVISISPRGQPASRRHDPLLIGWGVLNWSMISTIYESPLAGIVMPS